MRISRIRTVGLCLLAAVGIARAGTPGWQPSAGHNDVVSGQIALWPGKVPDASAAPGPEVSGQVTSHLIAGKPYHYILNVTRPTMTVYAPKGKNTGAAVVVLPGGGFAALAIDLEGTEACEWLTAKGITCVLVKYRVPGTPYDWHCHCYPDDFATSTPSLEDLQRAMGLVRYHAKAWHIDPHKIGVAGFSAGGFLVAEISTRYRHRLYAAVDDADKESARPDFAMAIYPGHLATKDDRLNANLPVSADTPPTFLVQAENDHPDGVNQSLVYYAALAKAGVPAEMHLYAEGGHAFGLRPTAFAITHWPKLAERWLRKIGVLGMQPRHAKP